MAGAEWASQPITSMGGYTGVYLSMQISFLSLLLMRDILIKPPAAFSPAPTTAEKVRLGFHCMQLIYKVSVTSQCRKLWVAPGTTCSDFYNNWASFWGIWPKLNWNSIHTGKSTKVFCVVWPYSTGELDCNASSLDILCIRHWQVLVWPTPNVLYFIYPWSSFMTTSNVTTGNSQECKKWCLICVIMLVDKELQNFASPFLDPNNDSQYSESPRTSVQPNCNPRSSHRKQ